MTPCLEPVLQTGLSAAAGILYRLAVRSAYLML